MLNIRKIQYIMHLAVVSEEASAVGKYLAKACSTYEKYNA